MQIQTDLDNTLKRSQQPSYSQITRSAGKRLTSLRLNKSTFNQILNNRALLIVIIVLQIIIIVLLFVNPIYLIQEYRNQQIIEQVAAKTDIDSSETPLVAEITDIASLKAANDIQAQVYKDAQNGDYVLGYTNKMIIFRPSTQAIIYEGDNPNDLLTKAQEKVIEDIIRVAKEQNLLPAESTETPQISIVTDTRALQQSNPEFYKVARNNDLIALFPAHQLIILYNQETSSIINSGSYSTTINGF